MRTSIVVVLAACSGCITNLGDVQLSDSGRYVLVGMAPPVGNCVNIGPVVGDTSIGASWTPAGEHVERAMRDGRNQTAARGGNFFQATAPMLKPTRNGGVVGATVVGVGFQCPQGTPEGDSYLAGIARADAARAESTKAEAAKVEPKPAPAAFDAPSSTNPVAIRNATKAKELAEHDPHVPTQARSPGDVQVVRDFPPRACSPVAELDQRGSDGSVVEVITAIRRTAAEKGANVVVIDPPEVAAPKVRVFARLYTCRR